MKTILSKTYDFKAYFLGKKLHIVFSLLIRTLPGNSNSFATCSKEALNSEKVFQLGHVMVQCQTKSDKLGCLFVDIFKKVVFAGMVTNADLYIRLM